MAPGRCGRVPTPLRSRAQQSTVRNPREPGNPKAELRAVLEELEGSVDTDDEDELAPLYRRLAEQVDVAIVRRHCPKGFHRLVQDLEELVRPAVADGSE